MRSLSISTAWDETKAVLSREGRLLVPVALAMVAMPAILSTLIDPGNAAGSRGPAIAVLLFLLSLVGMIGQLALIRLAIGPSLSVGEAITHALRRAPMFIAAVLLLIIGLLIVSMPLAIAAAALGGTTDPQSLATSPAFALLMLVLLVGGLYVAVRMMMVSPVASAETVGPLTMLKRSWELTRGRFWRLFAFLLLFIIAFAIVMVAVGSVAGAIARAALGEVEPFSGAALFVGLISGILSALVTTVLSVMLARIYVQLAGGSAAGDQDLEVSVPSSAD